MVKLAGEGLVVNPVPNRFTIVAPSTFPILAAILRCAVAPIVPGDPPSGGRQPTEDELAGIWELQHGYTRPLKPVTSG